MAAGTYGVGAVLRHAFAHGKWQASGVLLQSRHVWRRRGGRYAEEVAENPFAAKHGRGSGGDRSQREDASLPQQSSSRILCDRDAAKPIAIDARNPIMPG